MSKKSRGINAERDLIERFWSLGWAALRTPGSGSARHPSPDIIASNKLRRLAIECKLTSENKKYIQKEEIDQLVTFSETFGAEPWLALKFPRTSWLFIDPSALAIKEKSFFVSLELAKNKGVLLEELVKY